MSVWAIPLAALVISAAGFIGATVMSARSYGRAASSDWVQTLESKIDHLQEELAECKEDRKRLHGEVERLNERELALMRRVMSLEERAQ